MSHPPTQESHATTSDFIENKRFISYNMKGQYTSFLKCKHVLVACA